jgi:ABC-type nitrate/sulfonate/bicarbonate transport system permease component
MSTRSGDAVGIRVAGALRRVNLLGLLVPLALVGAWQWAVKSGAVELDYLPAPTSILAEAGSLIDSGDMTDALTHTLVVTVVSAAIAILLGGVTGIVFGSSRAVRTWTGGSVDVLRTIPVIALMPVALLVWGSSARTEIIVATFAGFWIMLVNTAGGVQQIHPRLADVSSTFRLSRIDRLRKVIAPAAAAPMLVGARLAVVSCLIVAIVAEMLVSYQGLGYVLVRAQNALQPEQMWAYAMACGLLGYLLNTVLVHGARLALPGGRNLQEVS